MMEEKSISTTKRANIISDSTISNIGNTKPKTRKSKSQNKTKKPVQKTEREKIQN